MGFWVTCGVKMMLFCHGWDWPPPQTASCIHIRHIQCVWAHWYAVHWYKVAALHSYTHLTCLRFWGSGSLVESKWCHYVMVEADSHLKLLSVSILDIFNLAEQIDMLSNSICLSTLIRCSLVYSSSFTQLYTPYLAQIVGFWVTCGVKVMSLWYGWSWQPPQTASPIYIRHIKSVWVHRYAVHRHKVAALHSYTHPLGSDFGVLCHLWSQNDVIMSWLRLTATSNWLIFFLEDTTYLAKSLGKKRIKAR